MDNNSNYALAEALEQAGVKLKAALYDDNEPGVIKSPAWLALDGGYFLSLFRPWLIPNAGTKQMQSAMEKYATSPRASSRASASTRRGPGRTS